MRGVAVFMALAAFLAAASPAQAIPALQLYSPSATYDFSTETWVTSANPFTLYVVGTEKRDYVDISNVVLDVSVPNGFPAGAFIKIDSAAGETTNVHVTLGAGGVGPTANPGTPPGLPPHGIFPTEYWAVNLPNLLVSTAGEIVYDYNPGSISTGVGDIQYYTVSYSGVSLVHFDLQGIADISKNGKTSQKCEFAPFSHDLEGAVAEPATVVLIGCGLVGLVARARMRGRRGSNSVRMPS